MPQSASVEGICCSAPSTKIAAIIIGTLASNNNQPVSATVLSGTCQRFINTVPAAQHQAAATINTAPSINCVLIGALNQLISASLINANTPAIPNSRAIPIRRVNLSCSTQTDKSTVQIGMV